jgi:hypothetical protein
MATAYLPLFVEKLANIEEVYHFNMFAVREGDGRHVEVLVAEPARVDLANRGDVEALLRRFYGQILADDTLAGPFAEIRMNGLESHLPVMCDFWQTVLFRAGLYGAARCALISPSMTGMR